MKNTNETQEKQSLKAKIENFWYYYKVPTIIILVVLCIGALVLMSAPESVHGDLNIVLVSAEPITEGTINFNDVIPKEAIKDINEDGRQDITFSRLFVSAEIKDDDTRAYQQTLESYLSGRKAVLYIFDRVNYDRMIQKDAFCPLDEFFDVNAYRDRVLYRNDEPMAFSLAGSKALADMGLSNDDLYALMLFRLPEGELEPLEPLYENAVSVLTELLK